ncbi:MAG: hypothetical protein DRJ69_01355 [Thermoprotei archaeon]|nr:MAG: hypothetical protein DRJ69_01355 [Thermoprotei archaeon]
MNELLELNRIKKNWARFKVKVALCYPNIYKAGMSGHTIQHLYHLLNLHEDSLCERVFKPEEDVPPRSVESGRPLSAFNILAFTFQYELDYVNFLTMLLSSRIPLRRRERGERHPLVIAGGPAVWANPCVLEDFVDLFVIGDAEPCLWDLLDLYVEQGSKERFLQEASGLRGVYVPGVSKGVERVIVEGLDGAPHPVRQVVPLSKGREPIFGRVLTLEATRSCSRRCRFCLVSWVGSPARHRSLKKLEEIVEEGVESTGVSKVAVIGAGFQDHPDVEGVCELIVDRGLELSIPSIRGDLLPSGAFKAMFKGGLKTVTMAPEAGSERLREALGKPISDEAFISAAARAREAGLTRLKLYFMVGLPWETEEDLEGVVKLVKRLSGLGFEGLHVSVSVFIPKACTPLQWLPLAGRSELSRALSSVRRVSKLPRVRFSTVNVREAELQALLSLGDRRVGRLVEEVAKLGGKLGAWRRASRSLGLSVEDYVYQPRAVDEELPWSFLRQGPSPSTLVKEFERAVKLAAA